MKQASLALIISSVLSASAIAAQVPTDTTLAKDQHFVRGNGAEPSSMDPTFVNPGSADGPIATDMFEGLVIEDLHGNVIPGQAQKWTVSADGLTYTFTLKDGLVWSNGDKITASDFVYAWQRAANPSSGTSTAFYFSTANILNAKSIASGDNPIETLGVKALDDATVQITLEKPTPYFVSLLSLPTFAPLPQTVVEKYGDEWTKPENIVTNGAYILKKWVANEFVEVTRNTNYWDNENTVINGVTYLALNSQNAELMRYQAGEVDMTNRVQLEQYQRYLKNHPEQINSQPLLGSYVYSFNINQAPFDNADVRKALTIAVDRDILVERITGQGEPKAYSPVPTTIPGYQAPLPEYAQLTQKERMERARKLLNDAGYSPSNPLEFTLTYNTSENHKKLAVAIASMWKPLGVKVNLENMEWSAYLAAKSTGDYQIARSYAFGDYPEPSSILETFTCGHTANESGYCNKQYDKFISDASIAKTEGERNELYAKAESMLTADSPLIPLYQYNHTRLVRTELKGVPVNNPKGNIYAKDLYFIK
ncbi:peptide ABC transporter substrate-binding protein [Vibrio sp. RE86]|uniref:peptide ABC transporter substrate-binding protein n=1 Tax=Vibrio sp. RE86 TaxID=2607605 RepID=UPI001493C837|nr:peptide ABC transporter substrate-binding protein [Vibrio sp. RE86]NOH81044.1 peptide ABC transporter substrate-binding protein [Vibrio sp. RE86]